jgi:hypothetical protein
MKWMRKAEVDDTEGRALDAPRDGSVDEKRYGNLAEVDRTLEAELVRKGEYIHGESERSGHIWWRIGRLRCLSGFFDREWQVV